MSHRSPEFLQILENVNNKPSGRIVIRRVGQ